MHKQTVNFVRAKMKGKIQNFNVYWCLYHKNGTKCAVKIKELLMNF